MVTTFKAGFALSRPETIFMRYCIPGS